MKFSKNWDLKIDPSVFKSLQKIPQSDAKKILKVINLLTANPYFGDIQKNERRSKYLEKTRGALSHFL